MRKIITSLIAILVVTNLEAQQRTPKLVVCITVDQLRGDYIEYFYNTFGERGFKRLMNEGLVYNNIRFEFSDIDQASAFATLFTGSNPCFSGIAGDKTFDFEKEKEVSILNDPEYLGNYTKENYSPKNLFSSTIGDELKIASQGRSDVYSIAPDAESAILSAGHAANGAFWMDNTNGKWATTTYYKGIPWYVDRYNNGPESLASRLETMVWTPTLPMEKYNAFPYVLDDLPFRYTFSEKFANCYPPQRPCRDHLLQKDRQYRRVHPAGGPAVRHTRQRKGSASVARHGERRRGLAHHFYPRLHAASGRAAVRPQKRHYRVHA